MNIMTFILTVTMVWIILALIFLPIAIRMPKNIQKGNAESAPEVHYIVEKILISLVLAIVISLIYWYCTYTNFIF